MKLLKTIIYKKVTTTAFKAFETWWNKIFMNQNAFVLQAIIYEGQDKNPEMCRVLLTHEVMCR